MFEAATRLRLGDLRQAMERYCGDFDADLVSVADAELVVEHASAIEKMAAALCAAAAARVATTSAWRSHGDRSPAHALARKTGKSVAAAVGMLGAAKKLESLPEVAAAARRGELSSEQAAAIADAATVDPSAEQRLLGVAGRSSLGELLDNCARTKAAADGDGEARRKRIHARRYLRTHTDADGAFNLSFRDNPEVGAQIMAVIRPLAESLALAARKAGRTEPAEAHAADARAQLARCHGSSAPAPSAREPKAEPEPSSPPTPTSGSPRPRNDPQVLAALVAKLQRQRQGLFQSPADTPAPPPPPAAPTATRSKVIVRIDLGALLRGQPVTGEVCEIAGFGPVAVSAVKDMIDTGDPFLAAVATNGDQVLGVAHMGRKPNAAQQTALEWLYPTCAVEGCSTSVGLENDHRIDWAHTHFTLLDLTDRLCGHHHKLKTTKGWSLVEGRGKRAFVDREDRRHPSSRSGLRL